MWVAPDMSTLEPQETEHNWKIKSSFALRCQTQAPHIEITLLIKKATFPSFRSSNNI